MTTVLIADDVMENRYLLTSLLKGNGYEVVAAADGAEALSLAQSSPPDLIVTDVMMPVMDGFELCRRWRADERLERIPFVFYTATYTDEKDKHLALALGADRFLIKPQENDTLLGVLREVLEESARTPAGARARPSGDDIALLREHNDALLRKLHKKVGELEAALAERTRGAEELRRANAFLDSIVENIPDMVFLKDARELRFVRFNRAGEELLGYSRTDLLGKNDHDFFPKEQADLFTLYDRLVLDGRAVADIPEEPLQTRHKGERVLHTKKVPILDVKGVPEYLLGISEDITERKRAEAERRESASLLRIAGRVARLGGWSVVLADQCVLWSDEVAAIHEMPAGHSPSVEDAIAFCAPEWRARIVEVMGTCTRDGVSFDEELEIITSTGKRVWVRIYGEPIREASGAITRVQGAFQEITDRKLAEQERQTLQNQLLVSQKFEAIGRLAGGVAHDFNNLLSAILSYASFAVDALRPGDPLRADLEGIQQAGERAAALTRQLLAFSRQQRLEPEVLSLNAIVTGVESMLRRLLGETIEIGIRLDDDLGSVVADAGQLEQVIMNLAVNARDAMPRGGTLTIDTANVELDEGYASQHVTVEPGRFVMLAVTDSGAGMDAATQERIFEPFFTTKERGKGTGLGLATVYGIVKQSGGSIWVYSELGRGTTFKVYLPRVDAAVSEAKQRPVSVMAAGSETVLVVEDEDVVRIIVERILRNAGYRVLAAGNGDEALMLAEQHGGRIDLLLTDVMMPRMSGPQLAERIAARWTGLETLYMSGYADNAILQSGMLNPGMRFLDKPFSAAELTRKVREALDAD
jgi:two-component system cell cycle sensor histidine kinase/response regulator CckA